jgi:hypothetical protein
MAVRSAALQWFSSIALWCSNTCQASQGDLMLRADIGSNFSHLGQNAAFNLGVQTGGFPNIAREIP